MANDKKGFAFWITHNYKYLLIILIYYFMQTALLADILASFGLHIRTMSLTIRVLFSIISSIVYMLIIILMFKKEMLYAINDYKNNFKSRFGFALTCWIFGVLVMVISSFIITNILKLGIANNEQSLYDLLKIAPIYGVILCCITGPFFEEMVFRYALGNLIKNKWVFIIVSGLIFGMLHVLTSLKSPIYLLFLIPYSSMGISFAYMYSKSKNIILPLSIHMFHNIILVTMHLIRGL